MNRKGFTLIELLAVIIILGVIAGVSMVSVNYGLEQARKEIENVFVKTLRDAIGMYLNSDAKKLTFNSSSECVVSKLLAETNVYEGKKKDGSKITFGDIIASEYRPIAENEMVNPANEKKCNISAEIRVFRDDDYVYYYLFDGSDLGCLEDNNVDIHNFTESTGASASNECYNLLISHD